MKKRWKNEDYRKAQTERTRKMSLKLWSTPGYRKYISEKMSEIFKNPQLRKQQMKISKALWRNPEYRAKYSTYHFSKMAKKAWENPEFRKAQTEKATKQWQNPEFRKNLIAQITAVNKKRIEKNPNFMKGTREIFTFIANSSVFSIVGGGHTVAAIEELGLKNKISHISTGGGALEKFMMGEKLPVVEALKKAKRRF